MKNKQISQVRRFWALAAVIMCISQGAVLPAFGDNEVIQIAFGDRLGGDKVGWALLVDGVTNATRAAGWFFPAVNVQLEKGTRHKITLRCTTSADVTRFDYELYIEQVLNFDNGNTPRHTWPITWQKEDPYYVEGNHYTDGDNTFDPTDLPIYITIPGQTNSPTPVKPPDSGTKEPINLQSGDMYFPEEDISIDCPGIPLEFTRQYNSLFGSDIGPLGNGWTHTYDWYLINTNYLTGTTNSPVTNAYVMLKTGEGMEYAFLLSNGIYASPFDNNWRLRSFSSGYEVRLPGGNFYSFDTNGVLNAISNQWGNSLTLTYAGLYPSNILTKVRHSNGKELNFTYTTNAWQYRTNCLISRLDTPSTNFTTYFSYDGPGRLTNALQHSSLGNFSTRYFYATNSVLTQRVVTVGDVYAYRYPTNGNGSVKCTNLVVGADYYRHAVQYDFNTNQYQGTNRTVLTYQTRGTNQIYEYYYAIETMRVLGIRGPGTATGLVSRGINYLYDSSGNATNETYYDTTVGESNTAVAAYDACHNVTNIGMAYCKPPSNFWSLTWDTNYNVATLVTDPEGGKIGFDYTNGLLRKVKLYSDAANSFDTTYSYTTNGLLFSVTNANGHWTQFCYGNDGYPTSVVPQLGLTATLGFDQLGQLTNITLPSDVFYSIDTNEGVSMFMRQIAFDNDERGLVKKITYSDGLYESFAYNGMGSLTNYVDRAGRTTRFTYAPTEELTAILRPLSSGTVITNSVTYDNMFNTLKFTDAKGRAVETYVLDIQDRVTAVTNLEGQTMSLNYGVGGFMKTATRFDGTVASNVYNSDGLLARAVYPGTTNFATYYRNTLLKTASNRTCSVSNQYNFANRRTSARYQMASFTSQVSYTYFPAGNISNVVSVAGTNKYFFDEAERITNLTACLPSISPLAFQCAYNSNNAMLATITCTNNGLTAGYTFDTLDRVNGITWSGTNGTLRSFTYGWNNAGMITSVTREDGGITEYGYDELDRLTNATVFAPDDTIISDEYFGYDEAGNRTSKTRDGINVAYTYSNGCNRLNSWAITQTNLSAYVYVRGSANENIGTNSRFGQLWVSNKTAVTPFVSTTNFWVFDLPMNLGTQNIVAAIDDVAGNVTHKTNTITLSVVTNGSFLHNSAGCVTNMRYTGAAYTRNIGLTWDGMYQLTEAKTNGVSVERNGFDAFGRRVWSWDVTTTNWFIYNGAQIVAEVNATGALRRAYVYAGLDFPLTMTVYTGATPVTYFYLTDHLGSVHAVANSAGSIVESYRYDAWGRVLGVYDANNNQLTESAIGNRILWQGREYNFKTGLYYFRTRFYSPVEGRWLSNDSIGISGGFNQYSFVDNCPTLYTDPFGLEKQKKAIPPLYAQYALPDKGNDLFDKFDKVKDSVRHPQTQVIDAYDMMREHYEQSKSEPFFSKFFGTQDVKIMNESKNVVFKDQGGIIGSSEMGNQAVGYTAYRTYGYMGAVGICIAGEAGWPDPGNFWSGVKGSFWNNALGIAQGMIDEKNQSQGR